MKKFGLVLFISMISASAFADCKVDAPNNARAGDPANYYCINDNGQLMRRFGTLMCAVGGSPQNPVSMLRIAAHTDDRATAYFVVQGDLWAVLKGAAPAAGTCAKATKAKIVPNIQEFKAVPKGSAGFVTRTMGVALDSTGTLTLRGAAGALAFKSGQRSLVEIKDFAINECYGKQGKPFSSFVTFALGNDGRVHKIRGNTTPIEETVTTETYNSIEDFKKFSRINPGCKDTAE